MASDLGLFSFPEEHTHPVDFSHHRTYCCFSIDLLHCHRSTFHNCFVMFDNSIMVTFATFRVIIRCLFAKIWSILVFSLIMVDVDTYYCPHETSIQILTRFYISLPNS